MILEIIIGINVLSLLALLGTFIKIGYLIGEFKTELKGISKELNDIKSNHKSLPCIKYPDQYFKVKRDE